MGRHTREGRKRAAGRCLFCPEAAYAVLDSHRVIPGEAGGTYRWDNIIPACATCHRKAHAGLIVVHERRATSGGRHAVRATVDGVENWYIEPSVFRPDPPGPHRRTA